MHTYLHSTNFRNSNVTIYNVSETTKPHKTVLNSFQTNVSGGGRPQNASLQHRTSGRKYSNHLCASCRVCGAGGAGEQTPKMTGARRAHSSHAAINSQAAAGKNSNLSPYLVKRPSWRCSLAHNNAHYTHTAINIVARLRAVRCGVRHRNSLTFRAEQPRDCFRTFVALLYGANSCIATFPQFVHQPPPPLRLTQLHFSSKTQHPQSA